MTKIGEHAVVLGASVGGLAAARVLAEHFESVTVVERDALPSGPANRRGVPQGRHGHALLGRGLATLSDLFPGFADDLVDAGVPVLDYRDLSEAYLSFGGHLIPRTGVLDDVPPAFIPSRPLLESVVRQRLRTIGNVIILDDHDVVTLVPDAGMERVTGVQIKAHGMDRSQLCDADLVVDATGRAARTPALLDALGYGRPPEQSIKVRVTYSSQLFRLPPGSMQEKIVLVSPVPGRPTGMALMGYEDDTWMLTVFGMAGCRPPETIDHMLDSAAALAPPHTIDAVRAGEALGTPSRFGYPESRWRRFDKLRRFPGGLLALGDAVCSFNPIYGQGMTVAVLQAEALRRCLQHGQSDLARRYFRTAAKPIGVAWQFAAGADLKLPEVEGHRPLAMRLTNTYADRVQAAGEHDPRVAAQFLRVVGLMDSPANLLRPGILLRAVTPRLRSTSVQQAGVLAPS
ncbi:FAD-dependent oxidoreductase [Mycolicibacterium gadium]|uniref:2-polyprenyl-6-methoxyphenol hydroxylase-like oxidoreductase n=1 Tax=Mycolicibacterium gadium TaxID=1794 RepID=A0ABT6GYH3_MYCGU|nr:2-polyprenyl-6-methoxyphenol hydroxylase-like oxidoreductase [Mycolicibacterium gadium]MDG5486532.1 2-polyprenyl-6-methoxyphenol hydroxylase-like oxidoreductase [Mycolicibacterium gadium]